jgi:hypothetical protein
MVIFLNVMPQYAWPKVSTNRYKWRINPKNKGSGIFFLPWPFGGNFAGQLQG